MRLWYTRSPYPPLPGHGDDTAFVYKRKVNSRGGGTPTDQIDLKNIFAPSFSFLVSLCRLKIASG